MNKNGGMGGGAIVGIVLGGFFLLLGLIFAISLFASRKKNKNKKKNKDNEKDK